MGSHSSLFEEEVKVGSNFPQVEVFAPNNISRSESIRISKVEDTYHTKIATLAVKDMKYKKDLTELFNMGFTNFDLNLKHLRTSKKMEEVIELIIIEAWKWFENIIY